MSTRRALLVLPLLMIPLASCGDDEGGTASEALAGEGTTELSGERVEVPAGTTCSWSEDGNAAKAVELPPATPEPVGSLTLVTSAGDLPLTLDVENAPCTTGSFTSLAEQGYFDGTECHRLTTEGIFVLQCGDPTGTGTGGPGYSFADELSGAETYPAGTLAMANAGPNTNGSQFFIVYDDTMLPPSYTVFGTIDEAGLEVVRTVAADGSDSSNGPGDGAPNTAVTIERAE